MARPPLHLRAACLVQTSQTRWFAQTKPPAGSGEPAGGDGRDGPRYFFIFSITCRFTFSSIWSMVKLAGIWLGG